MSLPEAIEARTQLPDRAQHSLSGRMILSILLVGAFLWSLLSVDWGGSLIHTGGGDAIRRILTAAVQPDLSGEILGAGLAASWRTLAYATAGVSLAVMLAFPAGVLASGVLVQNRVLRTLTVGLFRGVLAFLRAIHELVWAWLILAAIGLSPMTAVLALALPYAGILGRVMAEMLNDVPEEPLRALRSAGANELQVLFYGRLPFSLSHLVSYGLYRYECGIRSAAIMSFVGLGGLGYQIQISLDDLHYGEVWTFVYMLVALVIVLDRFSLGIRRRLGL